MVDIEYPELPPCPNGRFLFDETSPSRGLPIPEGWEVIAPGAGQPGDRCWDVLRQAQVDDWVRQWRTQWDPTQGGWAYGVPGWPWRAESVRGFTVIIRPIQGPTVFDELDAQTDDWGMPLKG